MATRRWSVSCFLLTVFGCIGCLYPIFLSISNLSTLTYSSTSNSPLRNSLLSYQYQNALLVQLAMGIPIFLQLLLESVEISSLKQFGSNLINLLPRIFLISGLILPSLLIIDRQTILFFICSESLRRTSIVGYTMTMLSVHSSLANVVTRNFGLQAFVALFFYISAELLWLLSYSFDNQYKELRIISIVIFYAAYVILINLSLKFHGILWPLSYLAGHLSTLRIKVFPNENVEIRHLKVEIKKIDAHGVSFNSFMNGSYMSICICWLLILPILTFIMALAFGNVSFDICMVSIGELCVYAYLQVILAAFLLVIPNWQFKR